MGRHHQRASHLLRHQFSHVHTSPPMFLCFTSSVLPPLSLLAFPPPLSLLPPSLPPSLLPPPPSLPLSLPGRLGGGSSVSLSMTWNLPCGRRLSTWGGPWQSRSSSSPPVPPKSSPASGETWWVWPHGLVGVALSPNSFSSFPLSPLPLTPPPRFASLLPLTQITRHSTRFAVSGTSSQPSSSRTSSSSPLSSMASSSSAGHRRNSCPHSQRL